MGSTKLDVGMLAFSSNGMSWLGIDHEIKQCGIQIRNGHYLLQTRDKTKKYIELTFRIADPHWAKRSKSSANT